MPTAGFVGFQSISVLWTQNRRPQTLLRSDEDRIGRSNLLCKVMWKQYNFYVLRLESPQTLTGNALVGVKNANKLTLPQLLYALADFCGVGGDNGRKQIEVRPAIDFEMPSTTWPHHPRPARIRDVRLQGSGANFMRVDEEDWQKGVVVQNAICDYQRNLQSIYLPFVCISSDSFICTFDLSILKMAQSLMHPHSNIISTKTPISPESGVLNLSELNSHIL